MSLSPVSAIGDMVAPVVLITLSVIFANGLLTTNGAYATRIFTLDQERRGILRGPNGEMLDEDSVPPTDRERLAEIRDMTPLITRRFRRLHRAIMIIWIAMGLLMLSVAPIAVAVTVRSEAFGFAALALVLVGVAGFFASVAAVIGTAARPVDALIDEARRTGLPS